MCWFLSGLSFLFHYLCVCFYANACCFNYCSFVMFESSKCDVSSFGLLDQDCFGYLESLWYHTDFRIIFPISEKNEIGILVETALHQ